MGINIRNLNKRHSYADDKIEISFSKGDISKSLSVYLKDHELKEHHILWEIHPSNHQSFDKTNEKVKLFIKNIVNKWFAEEERERKIRERIELEIELQEEQKIKKLMDSF